MNYKKYVLSKFITVLPFDESFFFKVVFEKKIKLTDTLVSLNYKKHSPYKNPFFTKTMENQNLYIWFYEKEISSKIILPEPYLLFNFFKASNPNTFFIMENYDTYNVLIIKDAILVNSYNLAEKDQNLISMEMAKYGLDRYKEINKKEYLESREEALNNIGIQELYKWSSVEIDKEKLFPSLINSIAYPLSFLLFFTMGIETYHLNQVEKKLAVVEERYLAIKNTNNDIREKINFENQKEEKWIDFVQRELPYIDSLSIFLRISKAFQDKEFIFKNFSIIGSRVKIEIETKEDFVKGLNILNQIDGLKNIALKHSNKKRDRVSYEATVLSQGVAL